MTFSVKDENYVVNSNMGYLMNQLTENYLAAHKSFFNTKEENERQMAEILNEDQPNDNTVSTTLDDPYYPQRLLWDKDSVWAQRIPEDFKFELGKKYARLDGKVVTIIAVNDECVQADDGEDGLAANDIRYAGNEFYAELARDPTKLGWRYNRRGDLGRCTASTWDDPRNLIPFEIKL